MFKRTPQPTFDDVASDETKRVRAEIRSAAREQLMIAARLAIKGNASAAQEAQQTAAYLRSLAISIPLDMIAAGM